MLPMRREPKGAAVVALILSHDGFVHRAFALKLPANFRPDE